MSLPPLLNILEDAKVVDPLVFECGENYFVKSVVVSSGTSQRHLESMAEKISIYMKRQLGIVPIVDKNDKSWITVDGGDVVFHFFTPGKRSYYGIEQLMLKIGNKIVN